MAAKVVVAHTGQCCHWVIVSERGEHAPNRPGKKRSGTRKPYRSAPNT